MRDATHTPEPVDELDDIESSHDQVITVGDVFRSLIRHPLQLITRWNWKSALLGAIMRAFFYFAVYKASNENWMVTTTAVLMELTFRIFTSGISGAIIQSFRKATPVWLSMLIVTVTLPIFSHSIEWVTHYSQERFFSDVFAASQNHGRERAFAVSVYVSCLSALFNIFTMRKGVFLVGSEDSKSFGSDIKQLPMLVAEFIAFLPNEICNLAARRDYLKSVLIFFAFGFINGAFFGIFRGKWSWAWKVALISWGVLIVALVLAGLIRPLWYKNKNSAEFEHS